MTTQFLDRRPALRRDLIRAVRRGGLNAVECARKPGRLGRQRSLNHLGRVCAVEGRRISAHQQSVHQNAKSIDIGCSGEGRALELLRCSVARRHGALTVDRQCDLVSVILQQLRNAEIQEFDGAVRRDQDVVGLDVAMNDQLTMRLHHARHDVGQELQALVDVEPVEVAVFVNRHAIDIFEY